MEPPGEKRTFRCPLNFESVALIEGSVTSDPDTEVWLIKAPADFTPESFTSHRIPLLGHKTQKVRVSGARHLYHVAASPCEDPLPCRAFLPQPGASEDRISCAAPFQGIITIAETFGALPDLHPIPDRPTLRIPDGLQQRFCPFGAMPPKQGQKTVASPVKRKKAKKRKRQEAANL